MSFRAIIDNDGPGRVRYRIQHFADVAPVLERAAKRRQLEEAYLNKKNEIRPQASLDFVTVMAIRQKYGIDALNVKPDQEKRFWQILQTEYPQCLTTNKKVYRPPGQRR
jgi:hypothetical protein